jgi:hypothetical protein
VTDFVCGPPNCVSRSLSIHIVSRHSQTLPASAALSRLEYIARRRFPSRAHHVLPAVAAIVVAGVSLVARTASKNCCCSVIRYACWPSLRRSLAGWAICPGASSAVALLFAARCRRTHPPLCSMCVCAHVHRTTNSSHTLPASSLLYSFLLTKYRPPFHLYRPRPSPPRLLLLLLLLLNLVPSQRTGMCFVF